MKKCYIITMMRIFLLLIVMNVMLFSCIGWASDLRVASIDKTSLLEDCQLLSISGDLRVNIENSDPDPVLGAFDIIIFEDLDNNGVYSASDNLLGSIRVVTGVPGLGTISRTFSISDYLVFRGNLIHVFVDSNDEIAETDETNNYSNTGLFCEYRPPIGVFSPVVEWSWTGSPVEPLSKNVLVTPLVVNLTDDNGDSVIDENDNPDIVFTSYEIGALHVLRAISGLDGSAIFDVTDPSYQLDLYSQLAAGDIDLDGKPEIVGYSSDRARIIAFEHDGTFKWFGDTLLHRSRWGGGSGGGSRGGCQGLSHCMC